MEEKRFPKFVVGSFLLDRDGKLFLRTTPSQGNKFTCINAKVEWGKTIKETIIESVREKTNLRVEKFELISLTDGINIEMPDGKEPVNMIFADYKVFVDDLAAFKQQEDREYRWLDPKEWLKMENDKFGPYIKEVIVNLAKQTS